MLAMADEFGVVSASVDGLAHRARVSIEATQDALRRFLGPDEFSRDGTTGERIEEVPGGWLVLNHANYRDKQTRQQALTAARVARHRAKVRATRNEVTPDNATSPSEAEAEADLSAAAESGGGEIIDIGFRDRYGTLVTAFGGRVDERVADEFRQMANDYTQGQINEAITLARRSKSGQLYPSRISRFLPDLAPRVNPRAAQNGEFKLRNAWDMMAPIAGEPAPEADQ